MNTAEMIAALKEQGYKVTKPTSRPRGRRVVKDHLDGLHRLAYVEECSACRFRRSMDAHAAGHYGAAYDRSCAICIDKQTDYIFRSSLVPCKEPSTHREWFHVCMNPHNVEPTGYVYHR